MLRPLIYKLYKELNYCPPKRNKQDFERTYDEEYKDPEHNSNREDLSKCEPEVYTEIEDVHGLYNHYVKQLKNINEYIDNLQKQNLSKDEYKQRRKNIIINLDILEKQIMKDNWDGIYHIYYRTHLRPLIYYLYKKLRYCPPNRPKRHFERKYEEYENPVQNHDREDVSKCETEQYEDENKHLKFSTK